MYASLEWIDLTYDVEFDPPPFALPKAGTDVLKALYVWRCRSTSRSES